MRVSWTEFWRCIDKRFVLLGFLFICFLTHSQISVAQTNSIVTNSEAGKAFIERDYQRALDGFNKLAQQYPTNLTIKRYQAICLDRLGRHEEATELLKQILLISTQAASVHYHLATIYYKMQEAELAEQHFNEIISVAPGSKYEELAQVYLDAIANQRFNFLKPGAPKRWGFFASLGVTDDLGSRVYFDGENRAGTRTSAYLSASYYFLRNDRWTGTVGLSGFRSEHSHRSLEDRDFKQWGVRTTLQRQTQVFNKPAIFRFSLSYRTREFGSRDYSDGLSGSLNTRIRFTADTATNFYLAYGEDKFEPLSSFNPEFFLTRQDYYYAGVDHSVYLKNRTIELGAGVFANYIDANTDNFNREGKGAKLFARFSLPYKFQFRASVTYRDDDYPDFIGDSDRNYDSIYYGVGLSRKLSKHFAVNLIYRKYDIDYSEDFGDVDNSTIGLNLSYVY